MAINDIILIVILILFTLLGLLRGLIKTGARLFSLIGGGAIAFTLGAYVNKLLIQYVEGIRSFSEQNGFFTFLVIALSYVLTFIVFYLILRLIFSLLNKLVETTKAGKYINRFLGIFVGFALGVIICDVYVWSTYGVSMMSSSVKDWVINDTKLLVDGHSKTLYELLLTFNLESIGKSLSSFLG